MNVGTYDNGQEWMRRKIHENEQRKQKKIEKKRKLDPLEKSSKKKRDD